jgi:hypothetical protein
MKQQEVQTIATDVRAMRCTNSIMHLRSLPILAQQKKKSEPVLVCRLYTKEKKMMKSFGNSSAVATGFVSGC